MADSQLQPPPISSEQPFWKRRWVILVATVLLTALAGSFTDEIVSYFLNSGGDQSKPTVTQNEAVAAQQEKDRQTKVAAEKAAAKADQANDAEKGFVALFNGKDLTGWIGDKKSYLAVDEKIIYTTGGNLYTEKEYSDFVFRFDFKLSPGANNGLGIRTPPHGDATYVGLELQILDDSSTRYKNSEPWQYHASIYGLVPAKRGHQKPVGQWNVQEVTAIGANIKVVLNGTTVIDTDLSKLKQSPNIQDLKKHPGMHNKKGHIGFLGHDSVVEFRNIRIKNLGGIPANE